MLEPSWSPGLQNPVAGLGRSVEQMSRYVVARLSGFHLGSDCWHRRSQYVQERRQRGVVGRFAPGDAQGDLSRLWCDWANDHMGTVQTSNATGYERHTKPALDQGH